MKKIILLLAGGSDLTKAVSFALEQARKMGPAEILPLYVIDDNVPASVSSWLIYVGFMGDKPSDDYHHTILKEYRRRAREDLQEAEQKITAADMACRTQLAEGPLLETIQKVAADEQADLLILSLPDKSEVGAALYHEAARALKKEARWTVKIIS